MQQPIEDRSCVGLEAAETASELDSVALRPGSFALQHGEGSVSARKWEPMHRQGEDMIFRDGIMLFLGLMGKVLEESPACNTPLHLARPRSIAI